MTKVPAPKWRTVKLKDIASKLVDGSHNPPPKREHGLHMLSAVNVQNDRINFSGRYISEEEFTVEHSRTRVAPGDVLLTIVGTIGRSAVVSEHHGTFTLQRSVAVIRTECLHPRFLMYQLQSPRVQYALQAMARGTAQKGVYLKSLSQLEILVPDLAYQRELVEQLDELFSDLDAGVASLNRAQSNSVRYRNSMLSLAMEGRLTAGWREKNRLTETGESLLARILKARRETWEADELASFSARGKQPPKGWREKYSEPAYPDIKTLPKLPVGWCWARAEQVCEFITKGTTPSKDKLFDGVGEIPFIKVYNLTRTGALDFSVNPTFVSRVTHANDLSRSMVFPGDVLMNIVGPPLGKISMVPDAHPEWNCNQAIAIFRPIAGLNRNYLAAALLTDSILGWAVRRSKATAGQHNLTLEICRDLPIPLPPVDEQAEIAARVWSSLDSANHLCEELSLQAKRAATLRKALLKAAFEGKLAAQVRQSMDAEALA